MKYGSQLEFFENVEAEGGHIDALDRRPRIHADLVNDYNVFIELSEMRRWDSMSGTPSQIQFSEIEAYLRLYEVNDQTQKLRLIKRLRFMDNIYLEYYRKKDGRHKHNSKRNTGND